MEQTAYLILENGKIFKGKSFGATGSVAGEVVFTTGMTGYLETLTDKSYYGQIVVQTFPLIGNYGVIPSDFEGASPSLKAYIVKQWCQSPSNFRSEGDLDTFLKEKNIIGLYDIDTRALTKIIRETGVMNGKITTTLDHLNDDLVSLQKYRVTEAVENVTCAAQEFTASDSSKYKVVLWDFGAKENIRRNLLKRGCDVICVPAETTAKEIKALAPDGVMLSNGPGDPADNVSIIKEIRSLMEENIPMFGICLGHQLTALAAGGTTTKLKYGHRGANQPVRDTKTGRVYITSQNHGYAVVSQSLPTDKARISFLNANDNTCEGVDYLNVPVFTVQFHPEASAGPLDTSFLFDKFVELMGGSVNAAK